MISFTVYAFVALSLWPLRIASGLHIPNFSTLSALAVVREAAEGSGAGAAGSGAGRGPEESHPALLLGSCLASSCAARPCTG